MKADPAPSGTILLVEPKVLVRMVLADYLRSCGYRVIEASGSDDAKLILEEGDVHVNVALIQVDLPEQSGDQTGGFALARWIRAEKPSTKVQLVGTIPKAANAAAELCEEGSVLIPPYTHQAVVDRIKRLLATAERNGEKS